MAAVEKEGYISTLNPLHSAGNVHSNAGHARHGNKCILKSSASLSGIRQSSRLLGKTIFYDDEVVRRITWLQRGIAVCATLALLCYVARLIDPTVEFAAFLFSGMAIVCIAFLCYKNVSIMVVKRLLKEPTVLSITALTIFNLFMEIVAPFPFSVMYGIVYMILQIFYSFSDAIVYKGRALLILLGTLSVVLNIFNIYGNTFGDWNVGVVLLEYTIQGNKHRIMKRGAKVSVYLQILLFSANGVYTMFVDNKMEFFLFALGNVYKKEILSPVQGCDQMPVWRIRWAQCGVGIFGVVGITCFIVGSNLDNSATVIAALIFAFLASICFACIFFKNVSLGMVRRLLKEPNVIIIIVLTIVHFIVETVRAIYHHLTDSRIR